MVDKKYCDTRSRPNTTMARSTGTLLVLIVYILHNGDALKCMQCKKASEPGDCSTTVECPAGESCYTEFYISPEGFLFYDMGCEPERVCTAIAERKKRSVEKRAFETLPLCQECCTDDYCNSQGCLNQATPLVNTSVCYKCDDVKNPRDCSFVEPCVHDNEICAATQSLDFDNFEIRYKLECMSKQRCKAVRGSQTEGHPVSNHTRREIKSRDRNKRNGINTCLYCCEDDFCNDRECSKGPGHVISHPHKTTGVLTTKQTRTTQQQFTTHKQYTTDTSTTKQTIKINTLHTTHKSTTTMQPKTTNQPSTTHKSTTNQPSTTHKSTTKQPKTTHRSTTKQPNTTHRSTTKQPNTTHRSTTKLPTQTQTASSGAITRLTTLKATSNLIKISTVKPSSTKPTTPKYTTQKPTSQNPNMSTWISASTNKNPQQPTTLTPTQKSTLWISAYTNSRPPNWITVPTDTKPVTWVSAKTDPVIFATPNVGN